MTTMDNCRVCEMTMTFLLATVALSASAVPGAFSGWPTGLDPQTVPGNGGRVSSVGTASPLLANYVVPGGTTFENAYVNGDWNSGFSSVTTNDLVFWDGSTYLLRPTASGLMPLEITGSVVASGTVRYAVDKSVAPLPAGEGIAVVNAVEGSSGDGTWTATSETLGRRTRVYGDESGLRLDYDKQGALIIVF